MELHPTRQVEGRASVLTTPSDNAHVGTLGDEDFDALHITTFDGLHERRAAVLVLHVDVLRGERAVREELLKLILVTGESH
jgi:hypothetical protein